jgi:hypothetical protein
MASTPPTVQPRSQIDCRSFMAIVPPSCLQSRLPAKQNGSQGQRFRTVAVLFAWRFHGETDLEGDLIVLGFTAFDMARSANHLEPTQIAQGAVSAVEPGIDRSLDAVGG